MINLVEDIRPVSYVKSHTDDLMRHVARKNNPVVITQNDEAKAVLMNVKQYQNIIDAMNLLKILSIGESNLRNNQTYTHAEIDAEIRAMLEGE